MCLVGDGLDMPSSIYDSVRAIKRVSVVFFWVKISTCYQGAALSTDGCLLTFLSANNQHQRAICPYLKISKVYMEMAWPCSAAWSWELFHQ